jgi:hypothetical protein
VSATGLLTAVAVGNATIGASYTTGGQTFTDSTQVTVVAPTSAPILSYLTLTPGSVKGGKKAVKGTVVLTAPATQDTVVTLTSSAPTLVTPPASVTIPSGSKSVQFSIPTSHPSKTQKVTVTATLGSASKVATLNLRR